MRTPKADIRQVMDEFGRLCDEDRAICLGKGMYIPCSRTYELHDILLDIDGENYLDMGCGPGRMTAVGAAAGFRSGGIEWIKNLAEMGIEIAEKMKPVVPYKIVQGSYCLEEFVEEMKPDEDDKTVVEPANGTYDKLGFGFWEVDVFYGCFWPRQARHVWKMFAKRAKPDAVLIQYGEWALENDQKLLDSLGLKSLQVPRTFFHKITKA